MVGDDMEILFENSYVRNKELAKEIYRFYYFQRKWLVICYVLLSLSFVANILISIFEKTYNWNIFIFVPVFFFVQLYSYIYKVNAMVNRDSEGYGKENSVETIVTTEFIQNTASTGAVNKLEFDKIRNAAQTKNLILLRSKANFPAVNTQKTSTAPGWCSILTGVWADEHGITGNGITKELEPKTLMTTLIEEKVIDNAAFITKWKGHFTNNNATYNIEKAYCEENNIDVDFNLRSGKKDIHTGAMAEVTSEDWLIIVTSDHGGVNTNHGGASIQERMTFVVMNK